MAEKKHDLSERLFEFAVRAIEFLKTIPYSPEYITIRTQLSESEELKNILGSIVHKTR